MKGKGDFLKIILPYLFILFLAVLGLHRYRGFSPVAASGGLPPAAAHRLLPAVASLVAEYGLYTVRASGVVAHTGPVAPRHVGSSQTGDRTCVSCIGR